MKPSPTTTEAADKHEQKASDLMEQYAGILAHGRPSADEAGQMCNGLWAAAQKVKALEASASKDADQSKVAVHTENLAVLLQKFYMLGWEDRNATKEQAEEHGKVHATIIKILEDDAASTDESGLKETRKG